MVFRASLHTDGPIDAIRPVRLRMLRVAAGLSQTALAKAAGLSSAQTVSYIERGLLVSNGILTALQEQLGPAAKDLKPEQLMDRIPLHAGEPIRNAASNEVPASPDWIERSKEKVDTDKIAERDKTRNG